jgi:hypothetical protein
MTMSPRSRRAGIAATWAQVVSGGLPALGFALVCCTTLVSCSDPAFANERRLAAGATLFNGTAPLAAHAPGDPDQLPSIASRCTNCHERTTGLVAGLPPSADGRSAGTAATYASPLDAAWLTTSRVRHGGPATRYDEAAFCTVLRTGVDPAQVMIPPVMPRYDVTDDQCASLWVYVRSR